MGSSFEYSYTCLASRLRRSARSGIMTLGKDKTPSLLEPSDLPTFQYSNLQTLKSSNLSQKTVSRNRRIDQILWILEGILSFYSFWTLLNTVSVQKQEIWPNSLNTSRDFVVLLFLDTFEYGKCQETWKRPNLLTTKVSRNMETTNSFEYGM